MKRALDIGERRHLRAVEYVRMSRDLQQLSVPYQQAAIRRYADRIGLTVVRTYADEAKSGLTMHGREALVRLLTDVQAPNKDFSNILVFDVSRWGRFQDVDEAGYYEFLCRKCGVQVHYCAEQFSNEPGPITTILKSVKRMMAAEYSRELSLRTALSMRRAVMQGRLPGGVAGYGLRRMLVSADGTHKGILPPGAWKSIRTDRTILVPGPDDEVATVRRIFDLFVNRRYSRTQIAELLNAEGVPPYRGTRWTYQQIRQITRSERYAGVIVYGRKASKLSAGFPDNRLHDAAPDLWVRGYTGYGELVRKEIVAASLAAPNMKGYRYFDDEALLAPLRRLLAKHGRLTYALIVGTSNTPRPCTLKARFGSMYAAYERAGFTPQRKQYNTKLNNRLRAVSTKVFHELVKASNLTGTTVAVSLQHRHVYLQGGRYVRTSVARYAPICTKQLPRWVTPDFRKNSACTTIVIRMDKSNKWPLDYFCIPPNVVSAKVMTISAYAGMYSEYRHATLKTAVKRAIGG